MIEENHTSSIKENDPPNEKYIRAIEWARKEERHEIQWINSRLSWVLVCQTFLITATVMAQAVLDPWWYGVAITYLLGLFGIWLSINAIISIRAAQEVKDKGWLHKAALVYREGGSSLNAYRLNRPSYIPDKLDKDPFHNPSMKLHLHIGQAFIIVWIGLLLISYLKGSYDRYLGKFANWSLFEPFTLTWILLLVLAAVAFYLFYWESHKRIIVEADSLKQEPSEGE